MRIELIGIEQIPEITRGADLAGLITAAATRQGTPIRSGDLLIVTQKVVSKSEGRFVDLTQVVPSLFAEQWAEQHGADARLVEVVLQQSRRIVRMDRGVIIAETHQGFVCANAGVDLSNVDGGKTATLLPQDADRSARQLRDRIGMFTDSKVAVVISDTFGRPWREGQVNVAVGAAGLMSVIDYRGDLDPHGYRLRATSHALADEVAAAAGLVTGKLQSVPAVILRGMPFETGGGVADAVVRRPQNDLFR